MDRFAALGQIERNSWLQMLAVGLLEGKKEMYRLLDQVQDEVRSKARCSSMRQRRGRAATHPALLLCQHQHISFPPRFVRMRSWKYSYNYSASRHAAKVCPAQGRATSAVPIASLLNGLSSFSFWTQNWWSRKEESGEYLIPISLKTHAESIQALKSHVRMQACSAQCTALLPLRAAHHSGNCPFQVFGGNVVPPSPDTNCSRWVHAGRSQRA